MEFLTRLKKNLNKQRKKERGERMPKVKKEGKERTSTDQGASLRAFNNRGTDTPCWDSIVCRTDAVTTVTALDTAVCDGREQFRHTPRSY